ncbi:hypothetical protein GGI09_006810 [Coemansia sp. S100]|nr:hypothetical protein LPJ71_004049 [Coemansia sp. S17]KAJ2085774.1 hypothetical protein GGI09_006810 [Coemansia sp. S100]KAJ2110957.1 hypothetical protein GGI16_000054 [Coemansia sp. S142-1]
MNRQVCSHPTDTKATRLTKKKRLQPDTYVLVVGKSIGAIDKAIDSLLGSNYKGFIRDLGLSKWNESKLPQLLKNLSDDEVVLFCYVKGKVVDRKLIEGLPGVVAQTNAMETGQFMHTFQPPTRRWWQF